jgi:hypothetical protein
VNQPAPTPPVVYYRDKGFLITSSKAKSPNKTYKIDKIEKIALRRDPFFFMIFITTLYTLFILRFMIYFEPPLQEIIALMILLTMTYFSARFGLLFVTSKAVSELAFIGLYDRLSNVREAIEQAMHRDDPDDGLTAGHDESEDEDE